MTKVGNLLKTRCDYCMKTTYNPLTMKTISYHDTEVHHCGCNE